MTLEGAVSIQEALSFLYENRRREDGKPHSDRDVADALKASGADVSYSSLWQIRSGKQPHPRTNIVVALAAFFGVPAGFFLDHEVYEDWRRKLSEELEMPHQRAGSSWVTLLRSSNEAMSQRSTALLRELTEHVRGLEARDGERST
ncbi:hypothetical protein [Amycolatopsis sp. NPDC051071]|uniref:hypothetical protein n=1 Tax=Amycolatopsis sp. NPDC051071 TaxID=3154637 RepID=UPI00343A5416